MEVSIMIEKNYRLNTVIITLWLYILSKKNCYELLSVKVNAKYILFLYRTWDWVNSHHDGQQLKVRFGNILDFLEIYIYDVLIT